MSNRISALAIVALSVVCLGTLWSNHLKNNEPADVSALSVEQKTEEVFNMGVISVVGDELQKFVADQYVMHFEIYVKNKDKDKAYKELMEGRSKVLERFEQLGIDSKSIEYTSVKVLEDWINKGDKRVLEGYVADQRFQVVVPDKYKPDFLEMELSEYSFVQGLHSKGCLKNPDSAEVLTIKKACEKATQMAKEYAGSVNAQVGKVYSVKGNSHVSPYSTSDSVEVWAYVSAELRLAGVKDGGKSYVEVSQSENKKFAADKFRIGASISVVGLDKKHLGDVVVEKSDFVILAAMSLGVADSEIETSGLHVGRRTHWDIRHDVNKANVFKASMEVTVNFTSKKDAAVFMTKISSMENVNISQVNSLLKNEDSLRVQVVNTAGKKALTRAKALAEGFGGKLGRVVSVGNDAQNIGVQPLMAYQSNGTRNRKVAEKGLSDGLVGLIGGGDEMNIADSVEISAFLKVIAEIK